MPEEFDVMEQDDLYSREAHSILTSEASLSDLIDTLDITFGD